MIDAALRIGNQSLPAWGAWIEIWEPIGLNLLNPVAPRMGSVD